MDPLQIDDLGGRRDVALNILRPSVRLLLQIFTKDHDLQAKLKNVEDEFQKLVVDPPEDIDSEILNNVAQHLLESLPSAEADFRYRYLVNSVCSGEKNASPELVVRFFDSPIHILQYIYNKHDSIEKEEISEALDELRFLRNLLWMLGNVQKVVMNQYIPATLSYLFCTCFAPLVMDKKHKSSGDLKIAITNVREHIHSEFIALYGSHRSQELPQVRDEIMDSDHPAKIMDEEVVDFFDRLVDTLRKKHMETLFQELTFLRFNLLDILQAYPKEMKSLCFSTSALIIEMAFKVYFSRSQRKDEDGANSADQIHGFFPGHGAKERATKYWRSHLPDLMDSVDSLKQQASDLFQNCYRNFSVPSSNHMESVNCLIQNLERLIEHKPTSVAPLKHQIEAYYEELLPVRTFLASENIAVEQMPNSPVGFIMARFIESANLARFIIDSFLAGEGGSLWSHKLGMFVVTNDIKTAYKKMKPRVRNNMKASQSDINVRISLLAENPHKEVNAAISSKGDIVPKSDPIQLVGVKDAQLQIIELLIGGSSSLEIVSIVGMPGLGKTTVANSVYDHLFVNKHFHVRAWCCVSQTYNRETLLTDLLSQVVGETNPSLEKVSGHDLVQMVYRNLKRRRYLIVIDDIWNIAVWRDLERTFPNDDNGSRILFTTQNHHVAQEANGRHYNLHLLSDKKSCKLLRLKVFDGDTCPPELSSISRHIAKKCKGLPLAVILVAGILRRTKRSKEAWEQVAAEVKSLGGEHGNHSEIMQLRKILELSYNYLPVGLRPSFLYFAAFPEDTSISVSKLIQLWISEGLVQEENLCHQSLEEEAESYLDELIDRSLVMVAKRSSYGGVKACRVHGVLRDFCSTKSGQERLMWGESMLGGIIRLHLRSLTYCSKPDQEINSGAGRRDGVSEGPVFIDKLHSRREVFSEGDRIHHSRVTGQLHRDFIFQHKFLKVLDLGKVRMGSSLVTSDIIMIATLVHLRFLGIRPRSIEIPAEIGNLRNLETLVLTGVLGYIKLPESLWNLPNLRNVLMDHGFFSFQHCSKTFVANFSGLYDLKSVSTLSLLDGDDVGYCILRRLPCIQKLSCRFEYSWNDATNCCVFPGLDFLNQLESLKVFFSGMLRFPCKFSFPSNIKKLSLSNSRLPWDEISAIVRQLPNLEVLKLLNKAFQGREWSIGDGEFPKLKFLKLEYLNIQVWNAEAEHLPWLEQLVVLGCPELEEIPGCFGEISTLQSIEMKWCSSSAMDSVNQILQTQRDLSNHQFKVSQGGCSIM